MTLRIAAAISILLLAAASAGADQAPASGASGPSSASDNTAQTIRITRSGQQPFRDARESADGALRREGHVSWTTHLRPCLGDAVLVQNICSARVEPVVEITGSNKGEPWFLEFGVLGAVTIADLEHSIPDEVSSLDAHGVKLDGPRPEERPRDRLQGLVHPSVQLDLVVQRPEDVGDGALLADVRRRGNFERLDHPLRQRIPGRARASKRQHLGLHGRRDEVVAKKARPERAWVWPYDRDVLVHPHGKDAWIDLARARNRVARDVEQRVMFGDFDICEISSMLFRQVGETIAMKAVVVDVLTPDQGNVTSIEIDIAPTSWRGTAPDL